MSRDNFLKATNGKSYTVLETYNLITDYGSVFIFKDSDGNFYISEEVEPDRGAPLYNYWQITEEQYEIYKHPAIESLKKLLALRFFTPTLFDYFIHQGNNLSILHKIVQEPLLPKIENSSVRRWFLNSKRTMLDAELFAASKTIAKFELPELVHASNFKDDNSVELDLFFKNEHENKYQLQKVFIDINKNIIEPDKIIEVSEGLPFFTFAHKYPVEPVYFGTNQEYKAVVVENSIQDAWQSVVISKGNTKLFVYDYPRESNLGRFWVFNDSTTIETFKNSVLFMYSISNHARKTDYYILRFEIEEDTVIAKTKVTIKGDSILSFSPNGRMIFSLAGEGQRSKKIKVVQL